MSQLDLKQNNINRLMLFFKFFLTYLIDLLFLFSWAAIQTLAHWYLLPIFDLPTLSLWIFDFFFYILFPVSTAIPVICFFVLDTIEITRQISDLNK